MSATPREEASPALRLHAFLPASYANGPGKRAVLWLQGCSLGCPGCFNPETHSLAGGDLVPVAEILERIAALRGSVQGVTISGGEPLLQRQALLALLRRLREETSLSVILFTGYSWEEVQGMPDASVLLACVDLLLAGRYNPAQRLACALLGSANKTVHWLTGRYGPADLLAVPAAELILMADGQFVASGIDPIILQSAPPTGGLEGHPLRTPDGSNGP
jgi:anaerobic ribonucleoside-triphosphate reductase activating protein